MIVLLNLQELWRTWLEMDNGLLSFKTPQFGLFSNAGKKTIYALCEGVKSSSSEREGV